VHEHDPDAWRAACAGDDAAPLPAPLPEDGCIVPNEEGFSAEFGWHAIKGGSVRQAARDGAEGQIARDGAEGQVAGDGSAWRAPLESLRHGDVRHGDVRHDDVRHDDVTDGDVKEGDVRDELQTSTGRVEDEPAWRLLTSLLSRDPSRRPSAAEALLGPYLNSDCGAAKLPLPAAEPWTLEALRGAAAAGMGFGSLRVMVSEECPVT